MEDSRATGLSGSVRDLLEVAVAVRVTVSRARAKVGIRVGAKVGIRVRARARIARVRARVRDGLERPSARPEGDDEERERVAQRERCLALEHERLQPDEQRAADQCCRVLERRVVEVPPLQQRAEAAEEPQLQRKVEPEAIGAEHGGDRPPEMQLLKHKRTGEPERRGGQHQRADDAYA